MAKTIAALVAGLIFGVGLTISQMIAPAKIIGFLDLFGSWDPSLIFVMAAAVPVTAAGYALARQRSAPLFAPAFQWPTRTDFDAGALAGGTLFGVGWGLSGYCPGPAIAGLGLGYAGTWVFVVAMLCGMAAYEYVNSNLRPPAAEGIAPR
jgi:uncharacterized protein